MDESLSSCNSVAGLGIRLEPGDRCRVRIARTYFRTGTVDRTRLKIQAYRVKFDDGSINTVDWYDVFPTIN